MAEKRKKKTEKTRAPLPAGRELGDALGRVVGTEVAKQSPRGMESLANRLVPKKKKKKN